MLKRLAFLFPGQGRLPSRVPPLSPALESLYAELEARGVAVRAWIDDGRLDLLSSTDVAQPAVLLDSLAKLALLRERDISPDVVAGHSLGEYAALVTADVLPAAAALDLVWRRGRFMAGIPGGMTAILKLDAAAVVELCAATGGAVVVANFNGPSQFVVSGPLEALAHVEQLAADVGGRAVRLAVAGPFHSALMEPAQAELEPFVAGAAFSAPRVTFVSSVSGRPERDAAVLQALLARQMTAPVLWTDVLRSLVSLGVTEAIEVGPGDVLTALGKRAEPSISFRTFEEVSDGAV